MPAKRLTAKERLFVAEFLVDKNATQAAIRAGYSRATAKQIAHEVLKRPHVQAEVEKRMAAQVSRTVMTAQRALVRMSEIAEGDPGAWNTMRALTYMNDYYGHRKVKVEHTGSDGGPIVVVTGVPHISDQEQPK